MSAESVSEATDEAIERAAEIANPNRPYQRAEVVAALRTILASPEGRRALLDVLQPTPEELGGERRWFNQEAPDLGLHEWEHGCHESDCVPVWRFPSERDEQ